jgi:hypothetical protein
MPILRLALVRILLKAAEFPLYKCKASREFSIVFETHRTALANLSKYRLPVASVMLPRLRSATLLS